MQRAAGAISPTNITDDLLIGGTATSSALFKIVGTTGRLANILEPTVGSTYDIGSSARRWATVYGDTGNFTNFSSTTTTISGTTAQDFLINTDNATSDTEDATLSFERGVPGTNVQFKWDATTKILSANSPTFAVLGDTGIAYSGQAAMIVNQVQAQDILTASASGVTKLTLTNTGNLVLGASSYLNFGTTSGTSGYGLRDNSGAIEIKSSGGDWSTISSVWQRNAGAVSPTNITDDLLIGATATSSAKFQIFGLTGSATASGNLTFSSAATIATTGMQSLTLGDANTGNIVTSKNISATGTLTGLTGLTVASGTIALPASEIGNTELANSSLTVTAGTGLTGGGAVSLGSAITLNAAQVIATPASPAFAGLTVSGSASVSGILTLYGTHTLATTAKQTLTLGDTNTGDIIFSGGNVGIGTPTPLATLHISDSQTATASAMITNTNTAAGITGLAIKLSSTTLDSSSRFINFLDKDGIIIGKINAASTTTVAYSADGTDMAEYFVKDGSAFTPGDVVSQASAGASLTTSPYDSRILGIVSTAPSFVGGTEGANKILVAIVGQVPVKIAPSSSSIQPGDLLTSSSVPGRAAKATQPGFIIGKALEAWDSSHPADTINIYISNTWADPNNSLAFDENGNLAVKGTITAKDVITSPLPSPIIGEGDPLEGEVFSLRDQIASISAQLSQLKLDLASSSAALTDTNWQYASVSGQLATSYQLLAPGAVFTGKLRVGLLEFDDLESSISSLTGTITVKGDLAVTGSLKVLGSSAGSAVIPAGSTSLTINSDLVSAQSAVFVTPNIVLESPLSVTESSPGTSFTVEIPRPLDRDLPFKWWIVN